MIRKAVIEFASEPLFHAETQTNAPARPPRGGARGLLPQMGGLRLHYGTMFSMSTRLVSLIRRIFILLAFARPRAAGIMLSSRA